MAEKSPTVYARHIFSLILSPITERPKLTGHGPALKIAEPGLLNVRDQASPFSGNTLVLKF